jgi:hypothetical protein
MKRFIVIVSILFLAALNSGCATLADAKAARGTGRSEVYNESFDTVWYAVVETVKSSKLDLISENKEEGSILAQGAISAFSWGENVAIYVEDLGGNKKTRVEVVNKRAMAANITAANWETRIFEALDKRLQIDPESKAPQ